jgi:predicted ATPase/class 3 adenylate cyclase
VPDPPVTQRPPPRRRKTDIGAGWDAARSGRLLAGPPEGDGTYAVLISDLEASTELWEQHDRAMQDVIVAHNRLVAGCVDDHRGWLVQFRGDGVLALFPTALQAVSSAVDIQRTFGGRSFGAVGELRIRVGISAGTCSIHDGELYGRPPNLAARLEAASHGGQIVVSDRAAQQCAAQLPAEIELFELGRYHVRGYDDAIVLHSVVAAGLRSVFPPLRTSARGLDALPDDGQPLIGREHLIGRIDDLVRSRPVVTVVGPAGVGKTRVCVRAAGQVRRPFRQGVRFVDLTAVDRPEDVAPAVAAVLRAQQLVDDVDGIETLRRVLEPAQLLLVLDNCEHVLDAVREVVERAARDAPGVHVLATSREPIGATDEYVVPVAPLATPQPGAASAADVGAVDAVRLFVQRARLADPGFALTDANATKVATVCRNVDGLPLALELAAGRMDVATIDQLAASGPDLVDSVMWSDRPGRSNLAGSVRRSHERLDGPSARLLGRLAVFAGGFTPDMAVDMAPPEERPMAHTAFDDLVRASIVVRDQLDPGRFRLLETTRQFLGSTTTAETAERDRVAHAAIMLARSELWSPRIMTDAAAVAMGVLRSDMPDHQRAMEWYLANDDLHDATTLLGNLFQYSFFDLQLVVHQWAADLAGRIDDDAPRASEVFGAAALAAWYTGDIEHAVALGDRAVAVAARTGGPTIWARTALVDAHGYGGDHLELARHFGDLIRELLGHPQPFWQINGLGYQTISLTMFGQFEEAEKRADRGLALARQLGNAFCTYWALYSYGRAVAARDPNAALGAWEGAMQAAGETDSQFNISLALVEWVTLCRRQSRLADCRSGALDLLDNLANSENRSQFSQVLGEAAHLLASAGDHETAGLALLGRRDLPHMPGGSADPLEDERLLDDLRAAIGDGWPDLETRALGLPEQQLVARCREALVRASFPT